MFYNRKYGDRIMQVCDPCWQGSGEIKPAVDTIIFKSTEEQYHVCASCRDEIKTEISEGKHESKRGKSSRKAKKDAA